MGFGLFILFFRNVINQCGTSEDFLLYIYIYIYILYAVLLCIFKSVEIGKRSRKRILNVLMVNFLLIKRRKN